MSLLIRAEPCAHAVLDGFLSPAELQDLARAWPPASWPGWHRYDDAWHAKAASDTRAPLPAAVGEVLARLAGLAVGSWLGLGPLVPDLGCWGGGLHELGPGGLVGRHQDAEVHGRLGLLRVLSASLYVHEHWQPGWRGELVLGDREAVLQPLPGRLVVFDARGTWHEVRPVCCPAGQARRSLALFWYAAGPAADRGAPGAQPRERALFSPRSDPRAGAAAVCPEP